ncbi:MAG: extracellular solute-binding protein [Actinomycetota bacterium]|nr:extracellular solute-binding protein [Actinomycetota bacterium]
MKRRIKWLIPVVGLLMVAAACSSGGGGAKASCDGTIDDDTLTVWVHEGSEATAYVELIDDFNASGAGVTIELTQVPEAGYTDAVNAAAAAGDLPDVIDFDGPTLANFAWAGSIVSIDECITDEVKDNLLPSIIQAGTYNDSLYSVGTFDSGLGLWAWKSALEEVGARIPANAGDAWSAEEFEKIMKDLQAAGYEHPLDIKIFYGTQGEWMTYGFAPIVWSAGADLVDRDSLKAEGVLNTDEAVAALTTFQNWASDGLIATQATDDSVFTNKESPISWVGHWMFNPYKEAVGDDLVLLPLPDFGKGTRTGMGSWAWAVTSASTDGDAAWKFLEFAVSDSTILKITEANGAVPATESALAKDPNYAEGGALVLFKEQLAGAPDIAVPRPVTPGYPTVTAEFFGAMDDILIGMADVKATLDDAAAAIDADVDDNDGYPAP